MSFERHIRIGDRTIGVGEPCYVIAEAGSNHNGDFGRALEMIDAAAEAKADAVKFQVFRPEELVTRTAQPARYLEAISEKEATLFSIFSKTAIDRSWLAPLAEHARKRQIEFIATPFDADAVALLTAPEVGSRALKNASSELWHLPLLARMAATGLPLLVSTGMATLAEVEDAMNTMERAKAREVALFHCTVSYPALPAEVNLRAIDTLRAAFNVPVGLSDHTGGIWAPIAAVSRGANLIEKHFTLSRKLPGPDHPFALEPSELNEMVASIRAVESALGTGEKRRTTSEEEIYRLGRRNLVASQNLKAGQRLSPGDVAILRSPLGLAPRYAEAVVGKLLSCDLPAGTPFRWEHFA